MPGYLPVARIPGRVITIPRVQSKGWRAIARRSRAQIEAPPKPTTTLTTSPHTQIRNGFSSSSIGAIRLQARGANILIDFRCSSCLFKYREMPPSRCRVSAPISLVTLKRVGNRGPCGASYQLSVRIWAYVAFSREYRRPHVAI